MEDDVIIEEQFENLQDCINFFTDTLACLREGYDKDIFTKREYNKKKKFIMAQFDANLRLIKCKDRHSIKEQKEMLNTKPINVEKLSAPKPQTSIEYSTSEVTIESNDE